MVWNRCEEGQGRPARYGVIDGYVTDQYALHSCKPPTDHRVPFLIHSFIIYTPFIIFCSYILLVDILGTYLTSTINMGIANYKFQAGCLY